MVVSRPPCDEDFDSASGRFEAGICSGHALQLIYGSKWGCTITNNSLTTWNRKLHRLPFRSRGSVTLPWARCGRRGCSDSCNDIIDRNRVHFYCGGANHAHVASKRRPDVRIGGPEQRNRRETNRSGEMRNTGVMPDKYGAGIQSQGELRKICSEKGRDPQGLTRRHEFLNDGFVRLPSNQKEIVKPALALLNELGPAIDRPILLRRTASRMKRKSR